MKTRFSKIITYGDFCFFILLCLFAYMAQDARFALSGKYPILTNDPGSIASYLLGDSQREHFSRDMLLGNSDNTAYYRTIYQYFVNLFSLDDNYGAATLKLIAPMLILYYLGFYILGNLLFHNRLLSVFFTIATGITFWTGWGTLWGAGFVDPLPRTVFAAKVGFFLAAAVAVRTKYTWHPAVLFLSGCTIYSHAISAIGFTSALFCGFVVNLPKNWRKVKYLQYFGLSLLAMLLVPAIWYTQVFSRPVAISESDAKLLVNIVRDYWGSDHSQFIAGYKNHFYYFFVTCPLYTFAAISAVLIFKFGDDKQLAIVKTCIAWAFGVMLVSIGINTLDHTVAAMLNTVPAQYSLARSIRLLVPISIFIIFYFFSLLINKKQKILTGILCIIFFLSIYNSGFHNLFRAVLLKNIPHVYADKTTGNKYLDRVIIADNVESIILGNFLQLSNPLEKVIELTDSDATFFSNFPFQEIRYIAKRNLAYNTQDHGELFYAKNISELKKWQVYTSLIHAAPRGYIDAWLLSGAEYLITNRPNDSVALAPYATVLWMDTQYLLAKRCQR